MGSSIRVRVRRAHLAIAARLAALLCNLSRFPRPRLLFLSSLTTVVGGKSSRVLALLVRLPIAPRERPALLDRLVRRRTRRASLAFGSNLLVRRAEVALTLSLLARLFLANLFLDLVALL